MDCKGLSRPNDRLTKAFGELKEIAGKYYADIDNVDKYVSDLRAGYVKIDLEALTVLGGNPCDKCPPNGRYDNCPYDSDCMSYWSYDDKCAQLAHTKRQIMGVE
jgi:hypothetical protein